MKEILQLLGITDYEIIEGGIEATLKDSNDFGRVYTKLENKYEVDEETSTVDNVLFIHDTYKITLIANYTQNEYILRISKTKIIEEWWNE